MILWMERKPEDVAKEDTVSSYLSMRANYLAYVGTSADSTYNPVGVMLDETEEDILEEVRFDINFETEEEW